MIRSAKILTAILFAAQLTACATSNPPDWATPRNSLGVPGIIIDHSPAASRQYIGSPSIAILPDGEYLASHDFFGPGSARRVTRIFASANRGETWQQRAELDGQWWSSLFVHRGAVYIMGTSSEYGFCVIRRSTDNGHTWTTPADRRTGLLHGDGP